MSIHTSTTRRGVLAGGNWIVDHVKVIDAWPAQDALANIISQMDGNGGCPYNILKDLALLQCGFPLAGIGLLGEDADAERILRDCDVYGIERSQLHQTGTAPTSFTDVMTVAGSGRRTFFHQHGANALLDLEHFSFRGCGQKIFYFGYLCLLRRLDVRDASGRTGASRLLQKASEAGLLTITDLVSNETSDFPATVNPSLPYTDYLLLNEYELARLVGAKKTSKIPSLPEIETQAREVLGRGVRGAVIVHFPEGGLCIQRSQPALFQPSVQVPNDLIKGAAGAGDAFGAGFVLGLHEGWEYGRCLELGVCAAAACLGHITCSGSIIAWQDCLKWGRGLGFNQSPK